jgi:hypothetical protein
VETPGLHVHKSPDEDVRGWSRNIHDTLLGMLHGRHSFIKGKLREQIVKIFEVPVDVNKAA